MIPWNAFPTATKIALAARLARVVRAARRLRGRSGLVVVRRGGVRFELDLTQGIDFAIYLLGVFEPSTHQALRRLTRPGHTVLDIGANVGAHTLHLAQMVGPSGRVIAFEPTDYAVGRLRRNLALNQALSGRVSVVQAYLTNQAASASVPSFYARWSLEQAPGQHPKHRGSLEVAGAARALTLDAYVDEAGLTSVDVVKLDVDGFECNVVRGGQATLARFRPPIILELCPYALAEHGDSASILYELLAGHGYRLYDERTMTPYAGGLADILRRIKPDSGINVVAVANDGNSRRH